MYKEKFVVAILIISIVIVNTACSKKISMDKKESITFNVVQQGDIPEELQKLITKKREEKMHFSYKDKEIMYICVGYGKQATGGYSVEVKDIYVTDNAICIDTSLIGPSENDLVLKAPSYPYVVVKIEALDKKVIYDD